MDEVALPLAIGAVRLGKMLDGRRAHSSLVHHGPVMERASLNT